MRALEKHLGKIPAHKVVHQIAALKFALNKYSTPKINTVPPEIDTILSYEGA
jgi:hypothetical protein